MKRSFLDDLELTEAEKAFLDDTYTFNPANMNQSRAFSEFFLAKVIGKTINKLIDTIETLDEQRQRLERRSVWIALGAMVVSLALLCFTTYQVKLAADQLAFTAGQLSETQKYNRLSVRPIVQLQSILVPYEDGRRPGLYINNVGGGPAIIENFFVDVDGIRMKSNGFHALHEAVEMSKFSEKYGYNWTYAGNLIVLSPGQNLLLLYLDSNHTPEETRDVLNEFLSHITIDIKYKSIYDEVYEAPSFFSAN